MFISLIYAPPIIFHFQIFYNPTYYMYKPLTITLMPGAGLRL